MAPSLVNRRRKRTDRWTPSTTLTATLPPRAPRSSIHQYITAACVAFPAPSRPRGSTAQESREENKAYRKGLANPSLGPKPPTKAALNRQAKRQAQREAREALLKDLEENRLNEFTIFKKLTPEYVSFLSSALIDGSTASSSPNILCDSS